MLAAIYAQKSISPTRETASATRYKCAKTIYCIQSQILKKLNLYLRGWGTSIPRTSFGYSFKKIMADCKKDKFEYSVCYGLEHIRRRVSNFLIY